MIFELVQQRQRAEKTAARQKRHDLFLASHADGLVVPNRLRHVGTPTDSLDRLLTLFQRFFDPRRVFVPDCYQQIRPKRIMAPVRALRLEIVSAV